MTQGRATLRNAALERQATLTAGQDLIFNAGRGRDIEIEAGESSRHEERRRPGKRTVNSQSRVQNSVFSAGDNLAFSAGDDLRLTASRLQPGGEASLLAGGDIEFLTAEEHDYSLYEKKSGGGLFSSKRYQRDEVNDIRAVGSEIVSGGDLILTSGADQRYQAARLEAGDDLTLSSGGTIRFETASDIRTESHEKEKSNLAWQSSSGEGFTRETLRQSELVAQGELVIEAVERIHIDVPEIDEQSVSQTIDAMVAADPDLAWLQEMEERGDIDWRQVKAFHDSWDYEQSGLGAGAMLAIAIVAAAVVGPAAAGLVEGVVASAMIGAGAASLATTGVVSLINNRGNVAEAFDDTLSSDSLRGAAIAALSAGVTRGLGDAWGGQTNIHTQGTGGLDLGSLDGIGRFAANRATQGLANAGLETAINGGSLSDNLAAGLEDALAHVVSGMLFNAVGDYAHEQDWAEGGPEKIALHALTGGAVAQAMGGDFKTGAMAAGASEALADTLVESARENPLLSNTVAQLVGIAAAGLVGGDVEQGAWIAGQAESYNRQLHAQEEEIAQKLAGQSDGEYTAEEIEQALRGMYHDGLGESPGSNVVVDLDNGIDAVAAEYFDYGGEWIATPGADGDTRYLIQMVPTDTSPELVAYIIEQTGGEASPYRGVVAPVPSPRPEPEPRFPDSIAMAAGLPYNLNQTDSRSWAEIEQGQQTLTKGISGMAALPIAGTYAAGALTARGAAGLFATGAGFDALGQYVQGGEYRPGQTLMSGITALGYGPLAGGGILGNAAVGAVAGGTSTTANNWVYDEDKSVRWGAALGAGAGGLGTVAGGIARKEAQVLPENIKLPYFQTPASISFSLPKGGSVADVVETTISNMPSFITLPDTSDEESR